MIQHLTDIADQAVILPVVVVVCLGLIVMGWRRAALAWVFVIAAVLGVILLGKLFAVSCATHLPAWWQLYSPSGHTASAAVVYGSLMALLIPFRRPAPMAALCAIGFAAIIGASRIILGYHSPTDVLVGAPVGVAGAYILIKLAGPRPQQLRHLKPVLATVCVTATLLLGRQLQAETLIGRFALEIWPFTLCRLSVG